jgi:hypothetical protein
VIGITLTISSAVVTVVRPWVSTDVDPYMAVFLDRTGAGTSA